MDDKSYPAEKAGSDGESTSVDGERRPVSDSSAGDDGDVAKGAVNDSKQGASGSEESSPPAREGADDEPEDEPTNATSAPVESKGGGSPIIGYVGFLAVIAASVGWVVQSDKPMYVDAPATGAAATDSGPCEAWKQALCEAVGGDQSASCKQAADAAKLLSVESCRRELGALSSTVERIEASRADCATLVTRLCGDLGEDTDKCRLVQVRTPALPAEGCTEFLGKYESVLADLQNMDQSRIPRGGPRGPQGSGHQGPPGAQRAVVPAAHAVPGRPPTAQPAVNPAQPSSVE